MELEIEIDKYGIWLEISKRLKKLKAEELKMRKQLCEEIKGVSPPPYKNKFINENGFEIEVEFKVKHKLDKISVNQLFKDLTDKDKNSLRYEPEIVMSNYKELPDSSLLHEAVTITPSAPTLKVKKLI
ncbi:MAG: hypothetical protein ABUK08_00185 [Candidatus Humimicrobiaceae bacterium]